MRFGRPNRERQLLLDMTPMIDIVFQLLIFFLTTAQMATLSRADMDLPLERGEQAEAAEAAGLIINVMADGRIIVSDREVNLDELELLARVAIDAAPKGDPALAKLTVRADRNASAARLNAVVERLHTLGVGAARIATSPPSKSR